MITANRKILGIKLYLSRRMCCYTQTQVAAYLKMTQSQYQKIESGSLEVSITQLFALCKLFRLSFTACLELCIGAHAKGKLDLPGQGILSEGEKRFNAAVCRLEEELLRKDAMIEGLKDNKKSFIINDARTAA